MQNLETDLPIKEDDLERFLDEQAHQRSRTKDELKQEIMKGNRFDAMWHEFISYASGN